MGLLLNTWFILSVPVIWGVRPPKTSAKPVKLSSSAIESMGFQPICAGEAVVATFHSLCVFSVRGFTLKDDDVVSMTASVAGVGCAVAVGKSVNQASNSILRVDYVEDEATWEKDHKCASPYAVVHFGPTGSHSVTNGYAKVDGNTIFTYESFTAARNELAELEAKAMPSIEMALNCAFSTSARAVRFVFVDRSVFGVTPANQAVHDVVIRLAAEGYTSSSLTGNEVNAGLQRAIKFADLVDPRVSHFFQLGLRDKDDLKRFLYYFLAIEIDIHRCFRTTPADQHVANGANFDSRVSSSLAKLIVARDNWRGLADRFIWCVVSVWKHLCDDDIAEFKRLKKVRDGIAHGDILIPSPSDVVALEKLVRKIHNPPTRGPCREPERQNQANST